MSQTNPSQPAPGGAKLVIVAGVLALLAVIVLNFYIAHIRREIAASSFTVFVLNRSVQPGEVIKKTFVNEVRVPLSFRESLNSLGLVDDVSLTNRITSQQRFEQGAPAGSMLTFDLFNAPSGRRDLDRNITDGKRLVSLPVNSRTVPGALREGMMVDIEAPFNVGGALPVTMPVMERVKVIAVGSRTIYDDEATQGRGSRPSGTFHTITIEVDPLDATHLSDIQRLAVGGFEIHLRNPADPSNPKIKSGSINPEVVEMIDRRRREAPTTRR